MGLPWGSAGKESTCNVEAWVRSLGWEDPLEKGTATHSSLLAWRIPWTVSSTGSQRYYNVEMSLFIVDLFNVTFGEQVTLVGKKNHLIKELSNTSQGRRKYPILVTKPLLISSVCTCCTCSSNSLRAQTGYILDAMSSLPELGWLQRSFHLLIDNREARNCMFYWLAP